MFSAPRPQQRWALDADDVHGAGHLSKSVQKSLADAFRAVRDDEPTMPLKFSGADEVQS